MESLVTNLIIGNQYVCKSIYPSISVKILIINKIETIASHIFVYTNIPEYTYQVYPQKLVMFYTLNEYNKISNVQNNYNIKIIKPDTLCPISLEIIQDDQEIITIDGTEHIIFLKDQLEKCFETKKTNPLTGLVVNNTQIKYYNAIIFNCDEDLFFY